MRGEQSARSAYDIEDRSTWPVLSHAPLQEGYDRAELSRYGDEHWDLTPAVFRQNARRCHCTVKFDTLSDPTLATMMRAYLYARLNVHLPGWAPQLPPASIRQAFNHVRPLFEFVLERRGAVDLTTLDQALLNRYAKLVTASTSRQPAVNALLLKPIWHLYHYRDHLPGGGLRFEPWPGQSSAFVAGYSSKRVENRTARIPEPILTPLLSWSLKYVRLFSEDIFAARAEDSAIKERAARLAMADQKRIRSNLHALRLSRVKRWLAARGRAGRGVPGWTQPMNKATYAEIGEVPVNWHLINLVAGVRVTENPGDHLALRKSARDLVAQHAANYGVERGGFDTPVSLNPGTNLPWRSGFDHLAVKREERMLQTAAYILCAYLTGMRDCEVQAMRPGCLDITRSEDGLIDRYRVRSIAYKWKRAEGVPADWIAIEPVAEAIRVLEHLSKDACTFHGVDTLWPVLDIGRAGKTHVSAEIVRALNAFRDHVNSELSSNDGADAIPTMHNGKPFKITTRQFRRTLAWHIANRPFGTIAGMIQYKHASVAAFEGYAGSSHSGFQRQVEQEHRHGQLDDILEYFDAHKIGEAFGGPAAPRLKSTLKVAARQLEPLPARMADRARLRTMLTDLARTFHMGILADCFFDPATALCLKSATDQTKPQTALCQPTKCPNACIRTRHLPAWQKAEAEVNVLLKEKRLSAIQRASLKAERERLRDVIEQVAPE
jgi:hypothetical protein